MKDFRNYWTFLAIRGAMTILACVAILAVPRAAAFILTIPMVATFSVLCLVTYIVLDAGVMVLLNRLLPARAAGREALFLQSGTALLTGTLLYLAIFGSIHWLNVTAVLWIIAAQAAISAVVELFVAGDTHRQYHCLSCYAMPMVLAACAIGLPFARGLDASGLSLVLAGYVGAYGACEFLLGLRMLFLEYRAAHPAPVASEEWKALMVTGQPAR